MMCLLSLFGSCVICAVASVEPVSDYASLSLLSFFSLQAGRLRAAELRNVKGAQSLDPLSLLGE